jgi:hypothetical protein
MIIGWVKELIRNIATIHCQISFGRCIARTIAISEVIVVAYASKIAFSINIISVVF